MANSSSSLDSLVSSGVDPKTAEALSKFVDQAVDRAVEKALRPLWFAALSRPQNATQNPASRASVVLTGIIALAAVVGVQLGAVYWLNDSIRNDMQAGFASMHDEFGRVHDEFGRVRDEIGSAGADVGGLRAEIGELRAEIGSVRAEVGELRERVIRIELLIEDRLP